VNAKDDCGYTALHLSAEHGYTDIMKILLEYQVIVILILFMFFFHQFMVLQAKVNFKDKSSEIDETGRPNVCDEPLHMAIKNGHLETARCLLENGKSSQTLSNPIPNLIKDDFQRCQCERSLLFRE